MDRARLETMVNNALVNDRRVDRAEINAVVDEAMSNGFISARELVVARNSLARARQYLAYVDGQFQEAEAGVEATRGRPGHAEAVANRDKLRDELHLARERRNAYETIEGIFQRRADPVMRFFGFGGNIVGDIGRGIGEIIPLP